jgi:uncharacterized protein
MGLGFYKQAVELQKKYGYGKRVENNLQTNGILLDKQWADFLRENKWLVGISLDGPEFIHNHYRFDKNRNGTHKQVEKNASMLLSEGVQANAICALTSHSVKYPEELYLYCKELGYSYMQFIPIVERDKNDSKKLTDFSVSAIDYGSFLISMFDLWVEDFKIGTPTTSIRHFESVFYTYNGMQSPACTMNKECGTYVVVEHDGNLYSCDFFVEPKWELGNVMHNQIIDMFNSEKQKQFGAAKNMLPGECNRCDWLTKCYGGCPKDRINKPQNNNKSYLCLAYKMFFEHADPVLKQMAIEWREQQGIERYV